MTFRKKRPTAVPLMLYLILCVLFFVKIGRPFFVMLDEPGGFRDWIGSHGIWGYLVFFLMTVLQVFAAVIPAEFLGIAAGYAFGWFGGVLMTMAGITAGQIAVFLLTRKYGIRIPELFMPPKKLEKLNLIRTSGKSFRLLAALFLIPGAQKDIPAWYAGLTKVRLSTFLMLTVPSRLSSVLIFAVGGSALGSGSYVLAAVILVTAAAVSIAGTTVYGRIQKSVCRKIG